jgi:hypothetical protein
VTFPDTGRPVVGVKVNAQAVNDQDRFGRPLMRGNDGFGRTDRFGNYEIRHLLPGIYNVNVGLGLTPLGREWTSRAAEKVRLGAGEVRDGLDFHLVRGGRILGHVLDARTRDPIPAAEFFIYGPSAPRSSDGVFAARADADGKIVACVPPGKQYCYPENTPGYRILNRWEMPGEFDVRSGETVRLDFRLRRFPVFQGKVVDAATGKPLSGFRFSILCPINTWSKELIPVEADENGGYKASVRPGTGYTLDLSEGWSSARPVRFPPRMYYYDVETVDLYVKRGGIRPRSSPGGRPGRA